MRSYLVIIIATALTILNISTYGELDAETIEKAKKIAYTNQEVKIEDNALDLVFGLNYFKFIDFSELLNNSEENFKKVLNFIS